MKYPQNSAIAAGLLILGASAAFWKLGQNPLSSEVLRDALAETPLDSKEAPQDFIRKAGSSQETPPVSPAGVEVPGQNQSGLVREFSESLFTYHRIDGLKDGSGLTGVQYPPVQGVAAGEVEGLKAFIKNLSVALSGKPEIGYIPPPDIKQREAHRGRLAREAAAEIRGQVRAQFDAMVESLQNPKVKLFVQKALKEAQPEFWRAPSSSSGKYHPADEINYGGLLVHTIRNVVMGRLLAQHLGLAPQRHDVIAAALILHDVQKGGIPWKHDSRPGVAPDSGYVFDHGPVAARWLEKFKGDCGEECDAVIAGVRDHMAQWNKPGPTPPDDLEKLIVSYADYLASRDNAYVRWRISGPNP